MKALQYSAILSRRRKETSFLLSSKRFAEERKRTRRRRTVQKTNRNVPGGCHGPIIFFSIFNSCNAYYLGKQFSEDFVTPIAVLVVASISERKELILGNTFFRGEARQSITGSSASGSLKDSSIAAQTIRK
jgi:hypothetical protein